MTAASSPRSFDDRVSPTSSSTSLVSSKASHPDLDLGFRGIQAQALPQPKLESRPLTSLCEDYVLGHCKHGFSCRKSHVLCRIDGVVEEIAKPLVAPIINFLGPCPRKAAPLGEVFDSDGPGSLSKNGPRHDNDYESIVDIKILPTTDEILSLRKPYMPQTGPDGSHITTHGPTRLIDSSFRLLRYESTEQIIDPCYHALQELAHTKVIESGFRDYKHALETPRGIRYSLFRNIALEEMVFHCQKGAILRLTYDCPRSLSKGKIQSSGIFEDGMLCALIGIDKQTNQAHVTFLESNLSGSTTSDKSPAKSHTRASIQLSFANRDDRDDLPNIRRLLHHIRGQTSSKFFLLDLAKVLVPGFSLHLRKLQQLMQKPDFAFNKIIAPGDPSVPCSIAPPKYSLEPDFEFNLSELTAKSENGVTSLLLAPEMTTPASENLQSSSGWNLETLQRNTTLDEGQAKALYENLHREIAWTQGPPGTGKSFLGVALVQVILASQQPKERKPILVTCLTNHALDDFLKDVLEKGITNIVRLGSASKEKWTAPFQLRERMKDTRRSCAELFQLRTAWRQSETIIAEGQNWAAAISTTKLGFYALKDHLQARHPEVYDSFVNMERTDDRKGDAACARTMNGWAYAYWEKGGDIRDIDCLLDSIDTLLGNSELIKNEADVKEMTEFKKNMSTMLLKNQKRCLASSTSRDVWELSAHDREALIASWISEIDILKTCDSFVELHRRHQAALARKRDVHEKAEVKFLAQQDIIGLTTTACARFGDLLNKVEPRVIIVEEASEVMLPHTLCSLLPSIQHMISIGDPLQLRPQINTMALSMEHRGGERYKLDQSLFERMMQPKTGSSCSRLNVQRRAHPEIADLLRAGDYSYLKDHPKTHQHPLVSGLSDRLFWLDHRFEESRPEKASALATSHINRWEIAMASQLVRYLIEDKGHCLGDIVVLTPYNGQLAGLASEMQKMKCTVWLKEEERNTLIEDGLLEPGEIESIRPEKLELDLDKLLRIRSIDNFQGEEGKIVIFSAVRSNTEGQAGFLKTRNRINVAISRARDGFYVLGNATLLRKVEHWRKVISVFEAKKLIGPSLRVCCSRHAERVLEIQEPRQFESLPPCQYPCGEKLHCGHTCQQPCHLPEMHDDGRLQCTESCVEILPCGHQQTRKCSEVAKEASSACMVTVASRDLSCGHVQKIMCCTKDEARVRGCDAPCTTVLSCGHGCVGSCSDCKTFGHSSCETSCNDSLACSHRCLEPCHEGPCPPCQQPCTRSCRHGPCANICSAECDPCLKTYSSTCAHQKPMVQVCCLPNQLPPCSEPCNKMLSCGRHTCSGVCTETCPSRCIKCARPDYPFKESLLHLSCGHYFGYHLLDTRTGLATLYYMDGAKKPSRVNVMGPISTKKFCCLICRAPALNIPRYRFVAQLLRMPSTVDHVYANLADRCHFLARDVLMAEESLQHGFADFCSTMALGPMAARYNSKSIRERTRAFDAIQEDISAIREVIDTFETHIRQLSANVTKELLATPNTSFKLHCDLLYFRCRLATIEDAVIFTQKMKGRAETDRHLAITIQGMRLQCVQQCHGEMRKLEGTIRESSILLLKRLEVDFRLCQFQFLVILRSLDGIDKVETKASIERSEFLCRKFPGSAGALTTAVRAIKGHLAETDVVISANRTRLSTLAAGPTGTLWKQWGQYQRGTSTACALGHLYPKNVFGTDCPECGFELGTMVSPTAPVVLPIRAMSGKALDIKSVVMERVLAAQAIKAAEVAAPRAPPPAIASTDYIVSVIGLGGSRWAQGGAK